jgi:hypothetical protein
VHGATLASRWRARPRAVLSEPGDLHDPQTVSGSCLVAAWIMKL